jgi:hypothetical protein
MNDFGRPTLYKPEYNGLAHNYCLLGATNAELAEFFDVAPRTIGNWIASVPEFAASVREGRAFADAKVARGLYERAVGFKHKVERTVLHRGEERTIKNTVRYPPDTQACIFWLRNRRPQTWQPRADDADDRADEGTPDMVALLDAAGERARPDREQE